MSNLRLAFILEAVDKASAKIVAIGKTVDRVTAPVKRVQDAFKRMAQDPSIEKFKARFADVRERVGRLVSTGVLMVSVFTAAAAAVTALAFSYKGTIDQVDRINDQAKKLGITVERYQELGYAAQVNGSNQEEMGQGLQHLARSMVEAINGSKEMQEWFGRAGISMQQLRKMNVADVMEAVADKFEKVGDTGQNAEKKIALLQAMMGRGGSEMKQLLDNGSAGLKKFYVEANRLGGVVSTEVAGAMADFNDDFDRMKFAAFGASAVMAKSFLPLLTDLVKRFTAWQVANKGVLAARIAEWVNRIVEKLPAFIDGVGQVLSVLGWLIDKTNAVVALFGGWKVVIGVLATLMGLRLVAAVVSLTTATWGLVAAAAMTPFGWVALAIAGIWLLIENFDALIERVKKLADFAPALRNMPILGNALSGFGTFGPGQIDANTPGVIVTPDTPAGPMVGRRGGTPREIGGTLNINVTADGQVRVKQLTKNPGSLLDFNVLSGPSMSLQ